MVNRFCKCQLHATLVSNLIFQFDTCCYLIEVSVMSLKMSVKFLDNRAEFRLCAFGAEGSPP